MCKAVPLKWQLRLHLKMSLFILVFTVQSAVPGILAWEALFYHIHSA